MPLLLLAVVIPGNEIYIGFVAMAFVIYYLLLSFLVTRLTSPLLSAIIILDKPELHKCVLTYCNLHSVEGLQLKNR